MRFCIKHEISGRIRLHVQQRYMSCRQADILQYYLSEQPFIEGVWVRERTGDVTLTYTGRRSQVISCLQRFSYEAVRVPDSFLQNSGREMNAEYFEKLVTKVVLRYGGKLFVPVPLRSALTVWRSLRYVKEGILTLLHGKIEVPVLDGAAIGISVLRRDMNTAGSVMFLLGIGELLEEWTHKKSVGDLARSMSLNVGRVWLLQDGRQVSVPTHSVQVGDCIVVPMANVIPFDATVVEGEGMVNQSSLTGEPVAVYKAKGATVYAGTVVEEGELTIRVREQNGQSRYEKIVAMIEESEKLKSTMESRAEHLADRLVPYTLLGTALVYLLTRNPTKALSVLMVDYSCALKLAMPISVLSAIREASQHHITVKGGRFLEMLAQADTVVFDKTGTLTKAEPTVVEVVSFNGEKPDELLRLAACLEEHFPHSMAKAVVQAAQEKNLEHAEMHTKVEYIVAHGISSSVEGSRVVIGSYHFVFEDEKCCIPAGMRARFDQLSTQYSHLYLGIEGSLAAVISIADPLRKEAKEVVRALRETGIEQVIMMTGDSRRTASGIAAEVGVDQYYAEVLPEDKAHFVEQEKAKGRTVLMIGDGINDSPALSAADVGVAINDGAELAREIADITIGADDLYELVTLKQLSDGLMHRIHTNYRRIVGINTALIVLGATGVLPPATSALLHNSSTLLIGLKSMGNLLPDSR